MKKTAFGTIMVAIFMAGCSSTINFVSVRADNQSMIEADQSTPITQDASGEGAFATQGAAAALGVVQDMVGKYIPDFSQKTDNTAVPPNKPTPPLAPTPQAPQVTPPLAPVPDTDDGTGTVAPEEVKPSADLLYKKSATYQAYGKRNGDRWAWRIPRKGPAFGDSIKVVFSSGKTFNVYNTSKNCRDQESCSRNSKASMYGFVFKPGIGPNGEGDNDTGTSHGGVYLHAPYGDDSQSVTFHFNE